MKPLLVGLNNPHSHIPRHALLPYPARATGARLLDMVRLVDPTKDEGWYLEAFDRTNLWKGQDLPTGRGSTNLLLGEGRRLFQQIRRDKRTAVLLGSKVWAHVVNRTPPPWYSSAVIDGATVYYVPHPSGLNRVYNDDTARRRAGQLLISIANASTGEHHDERTLSHDELPHARTDTGPSRPLGRAAR